MPATERQLVDTATEDLEHGTASVQDSEAAEGDNNQHLPIHIEMLDNSSREDSLIDTNTKKDFTERVASSYKKLTKATTEFDGTGSEKIEE